MDTDPWSKGNPDTMALRRAAMAEVDCLLDHLLHHQSTPAKVAKKLIQRFTTSNPSREYVQDVAQAFRTGVYGSETYSGKPGCLAATMAAILLHREAMEQTAPTDGLLREPLLKVAHVMRSLEYRDDQGDLLLLNDLTKQIGQWPYQSPSVFNFFEADYMPPTFERLSAEPESESEPEPEPESEPEPEPELEMGMTLTAPEFQIYTAPMVVGLLDALTSVISQGIVEGPDTKVESLCAKGVGLKNGLRCERKGNMSLAEPETAKGVVDTLDLLLASGRMCNGSRNAVLGAYEAAEESKFKAAMVAASLTPEFHNLGESKPVEAAPVVTDRHENRSSAIRNPYKAMVMLFLEGGADTFDMLVPVGCPLYDEYRVARNGIARSQADLIPITASSQQCPTFGVHPELSFLADLYKTKGKLAFVSNIGALIEPINRTTYSGKGRRCPGQFSHSHAQTAAQTLQCQVPGAAPRGAGGRMADELSAKDYITKSFVIQPKVWPWSQGFQTPIQNIGDQGPVTFGRYDELRGVIGNITSHRNGNIYMEEYLKDTVDAIESSEYLSSILDATEPATDYQDESALGRQLIQVAKLIQARNARNAERDIFFVRLGGFDTHKEQAETLAGLFSNLDSALERFVAELEAICISISLSLYISIYLSIYLSLSLYIYIYMRRREPSTR